MHHDLPNIGHLADRLASDNTRLKRCLERLPPRADALVQALGQANMTELRRLSEDLTTTKDACGSDTVRYRAERVCEELKKPNNLRAIRHSVVCLIGACDGQRGDQAQDGDWQI
jgi:hypothetical protein